MTQQEKEEAAAVKADLIAAGLDPIGLISQARVKKLVKRDVRTLNQWPIWTRQEIKGGRLFRYTTVETLSRFMVRRDRL